MLTIQLYQFCTNTNWFDIDHITSTVPIFRYNCDSSIGLEVHTAQNKTNAYQGYIFNSNKMHNKLLILTKSRAGDVCRPRVT